MFQRDIIVYRIQQEKLTASEIFLMDDTASTDRYTSEKEREVAQWVVTNNKRAGAGTETFSDSRCTYLSVRKGDQVYAVVGIATSDNPLDSFETSVLLSVLGECALALESQKNLEEKEAAAVLAKNEQLPRQFASIYFSRSAYPSYFHFRKCQQPTLQRRFV